MCIGFRSEAFQTTSVEIAINGADPQEWLYPVKVDMKDLKLVQGFCEIVQSIRLRDDAICSRVGDERNQDTGVGRHIVPAENVTEGMHVIPQVMSGMDQMGYIVGH